MLASLRSMLCPCAKWFPFTKDSLKADIIAGITVALILVPQSMAYAQLAGLPAHYGLYASFLPVMVAAMWGSSSHLSTGPVAVVSLLASSSLSSLAVAGSEAYIGYAIILAFLVGITQIILGALRMGVIINFLSHPVIVGFTNAAAIIIGLSQFGKLFRISVPQTEHFLVDIWNLLGQLSFLHLPTLAFGILAFAIMWGMKKYFPRMPGVLIAVVITTLLSWQIGFEQKATLPISSLPSPQLQSFASEYVKKNIEIQNINANIIIINDAIKDLEKNNADDLSILKKQFEKDSLILQKEVLVESTYKDLQVLKKEIFTVATHENTHEKIMTWSSLAIPEGFRYEDHRFTIKDISNTGEVKLIGGGNVIGNIPAGFPNFSLPIFSFDALQTLLTTAIIIAMVAFMEAISIAKSIASKTKDYINANQELIGQGLGNIASGFSQGFPVSGSFSRSAVNFSAGAKTGFSSIIVGLVVLITILFLTPLLYHLPESVLAAIIMMAVVGLINFSEIFHIWKTNIHDGIASLTTFFATLIFAPHLDNGIIIGAILAIILYLVRSSETRVFECVPDHSQEKNKFVKKTQNHNYCPQLQILRIEGSVFFGAVAHIETMFKNLDSGYLYRLIIAHNITLIDAAGSDLIIEESRRLRKKGGKLFICGIKPEVLSTLQNGNAIEELGEENIFASKSEAIKKIVPQLSLAICKSCHHKIFHECPKE